MGGSPEAQLAACASPTLLQDARDTVRRLCSKGQAQYLPDEGIAATAAAAAQPYLAAAGTLMPPIRLHGSLDALIWF